MATKTKDRPGGLGQAARSLAGAVGTKALSSVLHQLEGTAGRLQDYADDGGGPGLKAAVTGVSELADGKSAGKAALGAGKTALKESAGKLAGGGKGGQKLKVTNIVEDIDIPAPVRLVYDLWTQFADFPSFMKKVEDVEQEADEKLNWKAQVLWSHRTWEATIDRQVPDRMIVWTSKGQKGHVDGTVMFREIGPELTRVLIVLEYHPQGLFEYTGNLWRAQGRRVRLELKHFRRHAMRQVVLNPDEIEGWRGVIEDGEVVKDHQTAIEEEQQEDESDDEPDDEPEDDYDDESDEDDYDDGSYDDDEEPEDVADEYDEDTEDDEDTEPEDSRPRRRQPATAGRKKKGGRS